MHVIEHVLQCPECSGHTASERKEAGKNILCQNASLHNVYEPEISPVIIFSVHAF